MSVSDFDRHRAGVPIFESYDLVGYNMRMTDIRAAVALVQLERLPEMLRLMDAL